ncbi:MAG: hypothetical protein HY026_09320 [Deltaproteobacteria bacterium]|nr:hypothetical protein [Deltaproteobacteria bacterium]
MIKEEIGKRPQEIRRSKRLTQKAVAQEDDIPLITEIVRALKKHREINREGLPMVADPSEKYKKRKK